MQHPAGSERRSGVSQRRRSVAAASGTWTPGAPDGEQSQTVAAVERAADVLLHFSTSGSQTLGVTEIAADLGMSKAVVHRILASLRGRGLILFDESTRRYALGPMAMTLGLSYLSRLDVRRLAEPELRKLCQSTSETTTLSVRTGRSRVYVDQVTPEREVIMSVSIGLPFPLHAGASSKAFLAFLPAEEADAYLAGRLERLTGATVTDVPRLREELTTIRERGWAFSRGERQSGAASVAAPVYDHHGLPAAVISVCGPAERFDGVAEACVGELLAVTTRLSSRMGDTRP